VVKALSRYVRWTFERTQEWYCLSSTQRAHSEIVLREPT
jgi:hypothetical protein